MIEITYDGEYPCACKGTLTIIKDGDVIYSEDHCCHSTGQILFDDDWNDSIISGDLLWEDADKFSEEIQEAVRNELSSVSVCCGGCI